MDFGGVGRESLVKVTLYIEGGGVDRENALRFRKAWRSFFDAAGLGGRLPKVVRCGSRNETYRQFAAAVRLRKRERVPILLVDSEASVASGHSVWRHLKDRDDWACPAGAGDDSAFLMVQFMETWLVADRAALRSYFGKDFRPNAIPSWPRLENVPKSDVMKALKSATAACPSPYAKGRVSFELLTRTDPSIVERECPNARRLLEHLRGSTRGSSGDSAAP